MNGENVKFITYSNGWLGNQLYYALQAFIKSTSDVRYVYSMRKQEADRGIYNHMCRMGLEGLITVDNSQAEHTKSYCQIIGKDFSIDDAEEFIKKRILTSEIFKNISGIDNDNDKVSIHIRNGDYLAESKGHYHDCFDRIEYIKTAINSKLLEDIDHVVVFSDDISMCMSLYNGILSKRFKTVEFNSETDFEREFVRLSLFKNKILWNSTFSFWTAFIGNAIHSHSGITLCPNMFTSNQPMSTRADPRWTEIECIPI